jgi:hypothetical protein
MTTNLWVLYEKKSNSKLKVAFIINCYSYMHLRGLFWNGPPWPKFVNGYDDDDDFEQCV